MGLDFAAFAGLWLWPARRRWPEIVAQPDAAPQHHYACVCDLRRLSTPRDGLAHPSLRRAAMGQETITRFCRRLGFTRAGALAAVTAFLPRRVIGDAGIEPLRQLLLFWLWGRACGCRDAFPKRDTGVFGRCRGGLEETLSSRRSRGRGVAEGRGGRGGRRGGGAGNSRSLGQRPDRL